MLSFRSSLRLKHQSFRRFSDQTGKVLRVAIVGRPNVGKSTLFNRLTKTKQAIVSNVPGTTRDRREGKGVFVGLPLHVVDTGGLDDRGAVSPAVQMQVEQAFHDSDLILFMLDARVGITTVDEHFARWLRRKLQQTNNIKVLLLANKTEGAHLSTGVLDTVSEAYRLGFDNPLLVSAAHGDGMPELAQQLIDHAKGLGCETEVAVTGRRRTGGLDNPVPLEDRDIQLAIMGRPNVGKSTLLNAFLGEERVIAGPMPGLTRDAVHVDWSYAGRKFRLVDTAGLTRARPDKRLLKGVAEKKLEQLSSNFGIDIPATVKLPGREGLDPEEDPSQFSAQVSELSLVSAFNAMKYAQVVLLVIESSQGKFSRLDLQLARRILEEGRGLVIAANKLDLISSDLFQGKNVAEEYKKGVQLHVESLLGAFGSVIVIPCSGKEGEGIPELLEAVASVHDAWSHRINTGLLNQWYRDLMVSTDLPRVGEKKLQIKYLTQLKARPPSFALFCNMSEIPVTFSRFLQRSIQRDFHLQGVPIRFVVRKSEGSAVRKTSLKFAKPKKVRETRHAILNPRRTAGPNRNIKVFKKRMEVKRKTSKKRNDRSSATTMIKKKTSGTKKGKPRERVIKMGNKKISNPMLKRRYG